MKFDKIARIGLLTAVGVTMLSSCHIYKIMAMGMV